MSERRHRRVENVRLVRKPDGSLVMEQQPAPATTPSQTPSAPQPNLANTAQPPTGKPLQAQKQKAQARQKDTEIDTVWEEQMRLKEEADRLELEYKLAKKMTKELKQKMKEREPLAYGDPVFSDLLSPEVKDFGKKLKPYKDKAATFAKRKAKTTATKAKVTSKIVAKKTRRVKRRHLVMALPVALVIAGGYLVTKKVIINDDPQVQSATNSQDPANLPVNQKPDFEPLLPGGKSIDSVGGFARVSPQGADPVYAFVDTVQGAQINVSEQKLPESFKSDKATQLEKVAKDFQATSVIQIDQDKVYHGYSDKAKVQSLVFVKNDLLVLIRSPQKFSDDTWFEYITNLQ